MRGGEMGLPRARAHLAKFKPASGVGAGPRVEVGGKRRCSRALGEARSLALFPVLLCVRRGLKRVPGVSQQLARSLYSCSKMRRLAIISSCFWPVRQSIGTRYYFRLVRQSVCAAVLTRSVILPQLP